MELIYMKAFFNQYIASINNNQNNELFVNIIFVNLASVFYFKNII